MRIWTCTECGQTLYFDNTTCLRCGATLGFLPDPDQPRLSALQPDDELWSEADKSSAGSRWRFCANQELGVCNWMVPVEDDNPLCRACRLNRTIPDLNDAAHRNLWARLEADKRRLVYGLMRLGLPVASKLEDPAGGLAFDFLADLEPNFREGPGGVTGHADGLITIDIAEADDAVRERMRQQMAEPYRTVLGHFRHESGHYYWERLVRDTVWLEPVRECFGDERQDYGQALQEHYASGGPPDWQARFVSQYASCHPWEDWAETWAHYLHIIDTLETARQFGMRLQPRAETSDELAMERVRDPFRTVDFDVLVEAWLPLTHALNSLNRSMGQPDAYPFVLSAPAIAKLTLIHEIVQAAS